MIRSIPHFQSHKGFTLIEIIVTLMLVGISAAIIYPALGTNLIKSPEPIARLDKQYQLIEEMDKLTGTYRGEIENGTLDIDDFKDTIDTTLFVDIVANTQFINISDTSSTYTMASDSILMVTLTHGNQKLSSLFAE